MLASKTLKIPTASHIGDGAAKVVQKNLVAASG